ARHDAVARARVIAQREGEQDVMVVRLEATGGAAEDYAASVADVLKLKGMIEVVPPGTLPRDGIVIEDQRSYD
ncbi:MAG: phenylacetate--CoA ligase family protein, partial [Pseudomonadota bacterium]